MDEESAAPSPKARRRQAGRAVRADRRPRHFPDRDSRLVRWSCQRVTQGGRSAQAGHRRATMRCRRELQTFPWTGPRRRASLRAERKEDTTMQLGIHLPHIGRKASPDAIRRAAVQAEELGFADVWVSEHI